MGGTEAVGLQRCFKDNSTQDVSAVDVCLRVWWVRLRCSDGNETVCKHEARAKKSASHLVLHHLILE